MIIAVAAVATIGFLYFQKQGEQNARVAAIGDSLLIANEVQNKVLQYYFDHRSFPSSNSEAGIKHPAAYQNRVLKSITIKKGGQIWLVFNQESGVDNGSIVFLPTMDFKSQKLWACKTDGFPDIEKYFSDIEYVSHLDSK